MDNEPQQVTPPPAGPQSPPALFSGGQPPFYDPAPSPDTSKSKPMSPVIIIAAFVAGIALGIIIGWLIGRSSDGPPAQKQVQKNSTPSVSAATTYDAGQAYARNTKRRTDILALQTQLETFFEQKGYYPSLADMNNPDWRAANMKDLDAVGTMVDPLSDCEPATASCLAASPKQGAYAYAVSDAQDRSCERDDTKCAKYTLTATYESSDGGAKTFNKTNLD